MAPSRRAPGPAAGRWVRPELRTFPSADEAFEREARSALATGGAADPVELERLLRANYPRAAVHRRELSGEARPTWYVFRDGRVV